MPHLDEISHLFSSFFRQIAKDGIELAYFSVVTLLSGSTVRQLNTLFTVGVTFTVDAREKKDRGKEEMKCARETVDDGKILSDPLYKMFDSAQLFTLETICLFGIYICILMPITCLQMHRDR